jgi:hypothetical protein
MEETQLELEEMILESYLRDIEKFDAHFIKSPIQPYITKFFIQLMSLGADGKYTYHVETQDEDGSFSSFEGRPTTIDSDGFLRQIKRIKKRARSPAAEVLVTKVAKTTSDLE